MSEKELRKLAELCEQELPYEEVGLREGIRKALSAEPDVVKVLRWLTNRANALSGGAERDTLETMEWTIKENFHVRLTETGWEWTE